MLVDENTKNDKANVMNNPCDVASAFPYSFRFVLENRPSAIAQVLGHSSLRFKDLPIGSSLEVSPKAFKTARRVGELLTCGDSGGCGLIIDYGQDHAVGDSLRVGGFTQNFNLAQKF